MQNSLPDIRLDEISMAMRAAAEFKDGSIVNLGVGIPTLCSSFVPEGIEMLFHSENGVLGFGPVVETPSEADPLLVNAGLQPVERRPGMCFFSHDESFAMVRGGHIDITVLGALEVSQAGDLANYHLPGKIVGSFGGGQDLAFSAQKVIALMRHFDPRGRSKLVKELSHPITAPACVDMVITDIGVFEISESGVVLVEYLPGWTAEEILAATEAEVKVSPELREITLM